MLDLKNMGGGRKLIQQIIRKNKSKRQPWSKDKQYEQLSKQKNFKPTK